MAIIERNGRWGIRVWRHGKHTWITTVDRKTCGGRRCGVCAKCIERAEEAKSVTATNETIGDFADRWVDDYPRPKKSTRKTYRTYATKIDNAEPLKVGNRVVKFATIPLNQLDRPTARAFALKHRYLHTMLSAMYNDALNDGLVLSNPFEKLRLPSSRGRKDITPLTEAEVHLVADTALSVHGNYGPTFRAMILFCAYTGIRPGEMYALEHSDIDYDAMEIDIRRRAYRGDIDTPKSGKSRRIILPPAAAEALRTIPRSPGQRLVFLAKAGAPINSTRGCTGYWKPCWQRFLGELEPARRAEFESTKGAGDFYALRHHCATMLLERGVAAEDVAIQLGHNDGGALVISTYGHPSLEKARARLHAAFKQNVVPLRAEESKAANG